MEIESNKQPIKVASKEEMFRIRQESSEAFKSMTDAEVIHHFEKDRNWCCIGHGLRWYHPQRHD